jgi:hypothetical protein
MTSIAVVTSRTRLSTPHAEPPASARLWSRIAFPLLLKDDDANDNAAGNDSADADDADDDTAGACGPTMNSGSTGT